MPVVEALARGCYILGYAAANTPFITSGFGTLVETGNVEALASAMERFARSVRERDNPMLDTDGHGRIPMSEFRARAYEYANRFSPPRFRDRFLADFSEKLAQ
jgi:glycosyltransferase involved in cell wall biosynthesis